MRPGVRQTLADDGLPSGSSSRVGQKLIEQGKREGKLMGERELLMRLLRRRFGVAIDTGVDRRVAAAGSDQIETWATRVFSAATLYEVLAD